MERPIFKDAKQIEYVERLEQELKQFKTSPYCNSYIASYNTTQRWNNQLMGSEIDIFNIEDKVKFEMAYKYLTEQMPILDNQKKLLALMTPEEKISVENKRLEQAGIAEKLATKSNGKQK